jgi:hypothetical protein
MRKIGIAVFLVLLPVIGNSSAPSDKTKLASSNQPIPLAALFSQSAYQRPIAIKEGNAQDPDKVIMILQTRYYLLTVYGGEDHLCSVSTQDGVALGDKLSPGELKVRFPELHDLVSQGFACDSPMRFDKF